jgi:hypothetical protein
VFGNENGVEECDESTRRGEVGWIGKGCFCNDTEAILIVVVEWRAINGEVLWGGRALCLWMAEVVKLGSVLGRAKRFGKRFS